MSIVAITGGRDHRVTNEEAAHLTSLLSQLDGNVIAVGDCPTGVDAWIRDWAQAGDMEYYVFAAIWTMFKKAAGPIRNAEMMEYADCLIAFPGDRGTASCIREAKKLHKPVYDIATGERIMFDA